MEIRLCYFDEWLQEEKGQTWQGIYNDLAFEGLSGDEIFEKHAELSDEFEEHCENFGLHPQYE